MTSSNNSDLGYLDQPKASRLNIQYKPDGGESVFENPPRFMWLPVVEEEAEYIIRISTSETFDADNTTTFSHIPLNFFTPDITFDAGNYVWAYAVCSPETGEPVSEWSKTRHFTIPENIANTPLPSRTERLAKADRGHPRLWMTKERLSHFSKEVAADPNAYTWQTFFDKSVTPWMSRDIMPEPVGYPNHQRVAPIWRQTYIDCQELLYAIRHLAIGGKVTSDAEMTHRAKEWLLAAAGWDTNGTTSRSYTDEWAFRVNLALAWGYDWLYDVLDEDEKIVVRNALRIRTEETATHIMKHANIHLFPFDSHAVRAVSAVLIPSAIALLDDAPEAEEWLHYSIEFLSTVYTPWGDNDGGWAEGPHYWMTGMAYLIDAANLLKGYSGIDLYQRPFFQKTGDFPLYTKAPNTRRATFGDDSTMGDLPAVKIGYNLRQFAGVTGNGAYQWYYDEIKRTNPGTEMAFYNWGWWDFNFDELVYRTDFPIIEAVPPAADEKLKWFKGTGWVAIQHAMEDPNNHIQFVMKSSSYGSISHSHGDQNAFCLAAYGEDLAIQSGHYVAFNSTMHQNWRKQTISKNAIMINGKGQYAGRNKAMQMQSVGKIELAETRDDHIYIKGDATAAYAIETPEIESVTREVYFFNNSFFVFVDSIDASEPVEIDWRLHANNPYQLAKSSFRNSGEKAGFYGEILWSESGPATLSQDTSFADVEMSEIEGLPISTCLTAKFAKAARHRIVTLLVPYPKDDPKRIFHFVDDQGYDADLYFTDADENTFKVVVKKLAGTNIEIQ